MEASRPGLEGLAAWISTNYMGMGKSAMDALPELRRKGISAVGNSFSMGGRTMSAPEIAQALRLQVRRAPFLVHVGVGRIALLTVLVLLVTRCSMTQEL